MLRLSYHPENLDHWGVVLWNEFLFGINSNEAGGRGLQQNRLFLGVSLPLQEGMRIEPGYINVIQKYPTDEVFHVLGAYLFWNVTAAEMPAEK